MSGLLWRARLDDARTGIALAQAADIPEPVGRVLAARGVDETTVETFLNPTIRELMPDPSRFKDMDIAAARLADAVAREEVVGIFGDYDVDGATSGGLLQRYLAAVGGRWLSYIPDRTLEGYGPNEPALLALKEQGAVVVVTVDCGISAFEPLAAAKEAGLDVLVVDHHIAEARLPEAFAIVNPNRLDEDGEYGELAAVGVTFLLVAALNRVLRDRGWFKDGSRAEPDLRNWLDLVALGTVCDVVPLTGLNRAFVRQGLKIMGQRTNVGIAALGDVAGMDAAPSTYHAGFVLGPRVNAGGRVGESSLGTRLLTTEDRLEAEAIAHALDGYNTERKAIEIDLLDAAIAQVEERGGGDKPVALAAGEGWHAGVTGIVASRLKEKFGRPAVVIAFNKGLGKASCRSIPGVDIGAAVTAARQAGLLVNGGGHKMAAGFTVEASQLEPLGTFLMERLAADVEVAVAGRSYGLDGVLSVEGATHELVEMLEQAGPFGAGNAEPKFAIANARIVRADIVGQGHVRCILSGAAGGRLKAIAFRSVDSELGQMLLSWGDQPLHVAGYLRADRWRDRDEVQLVLGDAAEPV